MDHPDFIVCNFMENSIVLKRINIKKKPIKYIGLDARKPVFGGLQTTQGQTSLRIRAVWSVPLLLAF